MAYPRHEGFVPGWVILVGVIFCLGDVTRELRDEVSAFELVFGGAVVFVVIATIYSVAKRRSVGKTERGDS